MEAGLVDPSVPGSGLVRGDIMLSVAMSSPAGGWARSGESTGFVSPRGRNGCTRARVTHPLLASGPGEELGCHSASARPDGNLRFPFHSPGPPFLPGQCPKSLSRKVGGPCVPMFSPLPLREAGGSPKVLTSLASKGKDQAMAGAQSRVELAETQVTQAMGRTRGSHVCGGKGRSRDSQARAGGLPSCQLPGQSRVGGGAHTHGHEHR